VQSRNPVFQPREYLHILRKITEENNIALIFDEIITGFRIGIGGSQEHFDVCADIVTYGKVIGGGLPIGIVAGKAKFLDATDGGFWRYGDDSIPSVKSTFVAGTFCHHPLAMAASLKTLEILNLSGGKLLHDLNETTAVLCKRLNKFFNENGYQLSVNHFASLFRFNTPGKSSLLYYQLLLNGVYVWEGRNCFLSPTHTPAVLATLEEKIKLSCLQLEEQGIIKKKSASNPFI
jgi:iturin family lipopeptide synthetase A